MSGAPVTSMLRRKMPRSVLPSALLLLLGAVLGSSWILSVFVAPLTRSVRRTSTGSVARRAEEGKDDGGFLKFLKVEQDIELSAEEYDQALESEIESQRKKYYIGGVVKASNLVVPWKPVVESELERDARRTLAKNGIKDPRGDATLKDETLEDSSLAMSIVGSSDVRLEWQGGAPGKKIGYIVEKKRYNDVNFQEIASYEENMNSFLLAKPYAGHEYVFTDELVDPGPYTYRVLVKYRTGEVKPVDQDDITVPRRDDVPFGVSLGILAAIIGIVVAVSYAADPPVQF